MQSVISKIFSGLSDQSVHDEFIKFSKGSFANRYVIEGKKQKTKWAVKTTSEFANFFVRKFLDSLSPESEIQVKGIIVSTFSVKDATDIEIKNVKKYMGIQQAILDTTTTPEKIKVLMDNYPRCFYALSFKTPDAELKIKEKPPKSGKPGKKGKDAPKADFCMLKTTDKSIIDDLFFDYPDFTEIAINHTVEIVDIILPQGVDDPKEIREKAVRKGKIIRKIVVDGREEVKEAEFEA